jgi:hypothetical protein
MDGNFQGTWSDVGFLEVRHGVVAEFEEQDNVFRVGDPVSAEAYAHVPP